MLKRLLTYIFFILLLAGCSDEFNLPISDGIGKDGSVVMTLDIPSIREGMTRTNGVDEWLINDLTVLILNGFAENPTVAQTISISADATQNDSGNRMLRIDNATSHQVKLWFSIPDALRDDLYNLKFYFIANCPSDLTFTGKTLEELKKATTDKISWAATFDAQEVFVMTGQATFNDLTSTPALIRNAAKVSVTMGENENASVLPFGVFGAAISSPILSGTMSKSELSSDKGSATEVKSTSFPTPDEMEMTEPRYIHPTNNPLLTEDKQFNDLSKTWTCYVVVKASYQDTDYFYRLDFIDQNDKVLSPTANHWYKFVVEEVTGPGYDTPEEASHHPQTNIQYAIHDHSPLSFNMASDGIRELGVTHEVVYNGEPKDIAFSDSVINIKFFSKFKDEIPNSSDAVKALIHPSDESTPLFTIEEDSWLELSDPIPVTAHHDINGDDRTDDLNDSGEIYQFKLKFKSNKLIGTLTNTITVRWMGLERVIPVTWERNFNGADITEASLTIDYNGLTVDHMQKVIINDYWTFLSSTDDYLNMDPTEIPVASQSDIRLWGIQKEPNNGKTRNQGFHFPIMYGETGKYTSYSYTLSFKPDAFGGKSVQDVKVEVEGDAGIKDIVTCEIKTKNPLVLSISRPGCSGEKDYTYAVGKLRVKVKISDTDIDEYTFDLYHTGFFHKDSEEVVRNYLLNADKTASEWRYYEVVPINVNGKTRYILDRNLGAKSAEMYVRNSDGTTLTGNPAAAGGYYKVAMQEKSDAYVDPTMFDNGPQPVSPPGYCVPKQNVWDAIRNSASFHTENAGEYFNSYYNTGNSRIGKIYFPKSMFRVKDEYLGETRDGYYWTSTAATGTEKEEIGRWLKMFTISGNTTSYTNGCVVITGKEDLAYGASLRCVNKVTETTELNRTSFNVSGATHVYLYHIVNGERIATTTWPGHVIGNYDTMDSKFDPEKGRNWFGFSFESSDFDPKDLYVIFNFIDKDGIIHTYSKDSEDNTIYTTDLTPTTCQGWQVIDDDNSNLIGEELPDGDLLFSANKTKLGGWWLCRPGNNNPKVNIYTKPSSISPDDIREALNRKIEIPSRKKRIFLVHSETWWEKLYIYSWYGTGDNAVKEVEWPGKPMIRVLSGSDTYWYADIPEDAEWILFNDGTGGQTGTHKQTNDKYIGHQNTEHMTFYENDLK